jgi:pyridinium-3,5-biscarboxylic acid mononucleotide synthase
MDQLRVRALLEAVARGDAEVDEAMSALRALPFEDVEFATLDHHRSLRWGFPEVVYCEHKTPAQVAGIVQRLAERGPRLLATRATAAHFAAAQATLPDLHYAELARCLWLDREPERPRHAGIVVVAAGTSDLAVVEETTLTLDLMGHRAQRIVDVGVAGLHRLLPHIPTIQGANVVIVIAGMEGALASVVGGLTAAPVIAVPTSVGYGASFGGLAALLAMLNSCASGIAVVNIDNGYGAACMAAAINGRIVTAAEQAG